MHYVFTRAHGARAQGEVIDVRPDVAQELVEKGILAPLGPEPRPAPGPQDRAMQEPPRGRRA